MAGSTGRDSIWLPPKAAAALDIASGASVSTDVSTLYTQIRQVSIKFSGTVSGTISLYHTRNSVDVLYQTITVTSASSVLIASNADPLCLKPGDAFKMTFSAIAATTVDYEILIEQAE